MIEAQPRPTNSGRPYSLTSFQSKLDKFQQFIAKETLQDSTATTDEKRQYVNDNLRYEYFCERVRSLFGEDIKSQDLKAIHRKISTNPDARIDWSEVFGYFQAENDIQESGSDEISVFTVSKRKTIGEAAGDKKRRDTIQCVIYSPEFDIYVTASQKGALSLYNGKLRLQNCIDINESAWMTSCQYLPKLRKVIATTERSIIIWDHRAKGQNQSNIHVIKPLEHSPQCMCLVECADEHSDALLIGDDAGYINLIHLTHNDFVIKTSNDQPRVVKYNLIDPTTLTIPIVRRKFHQDWVLQVKYLPDLKSFASCSPGDRTSFVIASMKRMHDTSSVSELSIPRGVNAFCYSEKSNIFATGGVDKTIRIWHPNILSRPTGKMLGHLFTIVDIVMNEKDQHIISLSTARVFRVWDVHTLACLQVFTDSDGRSGERRISAMLFDGRRDRLFTGSSSLDLWPMTRTVQDSMSVPHTHDHPLTTVVLHTSVSHSHVLTVCSESVLKVWEIETGRQMYQIMEAHGPNIEITSAAINSDGTRMVTGAFDGSLKVWEFGNGQELKGFTLEDVKEEDQSVFWVAYVGEKAQVAPTETYEQESEETVSADNGPNIQLADKASDSPTHIIAFGWNNKLRMFKDDTEEDDLILDLQFNGIYEWPLLSESPTPSEQEASNEQEEIVQRKIDVLLSNELTQCMLMCDVDSKLLITGCCNGNIVMWDIETGSVTNIIEFSKAELASSYESHRHRNKELFPHRVNRMLILLHVIFRPDPEELKKRRKLLKQQKMEKEMAEDENKSSDEDDNDDQAEEEEELDIQEDGSDSEDHEDDDHDHELDHELFMKDEPIKMVEIKFPKVIASCHQDSHIRFWSQSGDLLCSVTPMMRILSPLTCLCCDEFANLIIAGDAKGYVIVWEVTEFLQKTTTVFSQPARQELVKQVVCWRAHLTKVVSLCFDNKSKVLISASSDGSVRVWYPLRGQYVGYFGQHRIWHISPNPSVPSSPVLPYDITETPLSTVNVKATRRKPQNKKYDYPLVFEAEKWQPFRRSAYKREPTQTETNQLPVQSNLNVIEIRNKKFFSALVKPRADKSGLESDKPIDSDTGAIFHHLPVYRIRTPPVQMRPTNLGYEAAWKEDDGGSREAKRGQQANSKKGNFPAVLEPASHKASKPNKIQGLSNPRKR